MYYFCNTIELIIMYLLRKLEIQILGLFAVPTNVHIPILCLLVRIIVGFVTI